MGSGARVRGAAEVGSGEASIFVRWAGAGPPLLLLHGFPQTHLMWRRVATLLAQHFTVVCGDLGGYGQSGFPAFARAHELYSKRAMARDIVAVMARLGFQRCGNPLEKRAKSGPRRSEWKKFRIENDQTSGAGRTAM